MVLADDGVGIAPVIDSITVFATLVV